MSKYVSKLILTVVLSVCMLTQCVPAYAKEYSGDGNATCTVSATINSTYTVSIPATLLLSKATSGIDLGKYVGKYAVGARGDIAANAKVYIVPNSMITLSAAGKKDVVATVSQPQTVWTSDQLGDTFSMVEGTVVAPLTQAGSWTGGLVFRFGIQYD